MCNLFAFTRVTVHSLHTLPVHGYPLHLPDISSSPLRFAILITDIIEELTKRLCTIQIVTIVMINKRVVVYLFDRVLSANLVVERQHESLDDSWIAVRYSDMKARLVAILVRLVLG